MRSAPSTDPRDLRAAAREERHLCRPGLSAAARERIYPHLQLVTMPLGKVLYEPGDKLRHVYFPLNAIVSLLYVLEEDGVSAEISAVATKASSASRTRS